MKIRSESALMSDNTSNAMVEDSRKILLKSGFSASEAEMFIQKLVSVLDDYADCLGEGVKVKYLIWKGIVNMEFRVLIPGEAFDPFMEGDGAQERSFEKMFSLNLSAGNSRLTYRYTKKCNCISLSIPLSEKSKKIIKDPVVWGVILGFLCGFICSLLPQETRSFVTDSMATPLLNIILTVISGVMGPVIFFSLVSSTIALAGINDLTNLGFKIIRRFILIILFLIVVSILISGLIFQNFGTGGSGFSLDQLFELILGVVPTNLIDPFLKNNTAQLVILGLLIGAGVLVLGDSVPELKRMIEQINKLVMSVMQIVLLTMPAIPFPSILIALGSGKGKGLLSGWKYVVASYAIFTICILIKGGLVMRKENCLLPILMSVLLTIFAGGGFAIAQEAQETELTLEDYAEDRVPSDTAEKEYTLDRVVALSRHNIRSPLSGSGSLLGDITPHTWFEWTSNPSELSIRGALLETQMGQYFRLWLENEGLFPENYRPNEGEVRFYANAKQRTRATAHYFSAGLLPVGNVTIEMHGDYDTMDSVFNPAVTFYNDDYRKAVEEQIAEKGGIADMNGIHAGLRDAIDLLMDVVDMEQSEAYKAGNFGDLQNPGLTMILKAGDEPDVSGFLKTANSVADALTFQFYEMADEKAAAFGHDLTIEDWRKIHTIVDAYTEIRFGMPLLAVNIAHPLLLEIRDELQAEGRKFSFLCGHDANISSVLSALGVSDYLLPETVEQKTPIGSKLLFSRWLDKNGEPYWSVELVYQNTDQLRNMTPLSLAAPPVRYALDFEGVSKNADGMIAESDFMALFDNAVSAYDALADQYGAEVIDEAA